MEQNIVPEKYIYCGRDEVFTNSKILFIEYNDILKSPWLLSLTILNCFSDIVKCFDITEIEDIKSDLSKLYDWYINRKEINPLRCLPKKSDIFKDEELDDLMNELVLDKVASAPCELNFFNVLKNIINQKTLVDKIIVYLEYDNNSIKKDLFSHFDKIQVLHGDIREVLSENTKKYDTTYVFSDITKINILNELDLLEYSSILLPEGYRYNKNDDGTYKVDTDKLQMEHPVKIYFFNNIT